MAILNGTSIGSDGQKEENPVEFEKFLDGFLYLLTIIKKYIILKLLVNDWLIVRQFRAMYEERCSCYGKAK